MSLHTKAQRAEQARLAAAAAELDALRDALCRAYNVFNATGDPVLLEASILEIAALRARYDSRLRSIKAMDEASPYRSLGTVSVLP